MAYPLGCSGCPFVLAFSTHELLLRMVATRKKAGYSNDCFPLFYIDRGVALTPSIRCKDRTWTARLVLQDDLRVQRNQEGVEKKEHVRATVEQHVTKK